MNGNIQNSKVLTSQLWKDIILASVKKNKWDIFHTSVLTISVIYEKIVASVFSHMNFSTAYKPFSARVSPISIKVKLPWH